MKLWHCSKNKNKIKNLKHKNGKLSLFAEKPGEKEETACSIEL
jgi:hypothetical protein